MRERAGFSSVRTVLASGNATFVVSRLSESAVQKKVDAALHDALGRRVLTIPRPLDALQALLDADPFAEFKLPKDGKRIVTFLREVPEEPPPLPIVREGATLHALRGGEAFSSYVPHPRQGAFMAVIEKTFGSEVTTRTWKTVKKVFNLRWLERR